MCSLLHKLHCVSIWVKYEIYLPVIQIKAQIHLRCNRSPGSKTQGHIYCNTPNRKCATIVSHNYFEDFDKVDYEGKRGKKAVSGKKKVWNFPMKSEKNKHFCGKRFLEGGFPGTRPPLRRKSEKMSGTSRFATAVTMKLVAEPCFIFL